MDLSIEAKVMAGTFWGPIYLTTLSFERPWILHPSARKGLDDLVEAGFLGMEPRNDLKDCPIDWQPTLKMKMENPKVSQAFIIKNSFPLTTE